MRSRYLGLVGLSWLLTGLFGAACASAPAPAPPPEPAASSATPYRPGEMPIQLGDEPDEEVKVAMDQGYMNQSDVNAVLETHTPTLIACYERAGDARKYASGEVELRFLVAASGKVNDVLVVRNQLGNYPVERCLVVEGKKIPFPKPGGDADADFHYTITFQSTQQHSVVDSKDPQLRQAIFSKRKSLDHCGAPSKKPVDAVAYVRSDGDVVSAGLVSEGRLDIMAAMCVVEEIRAWRLPGDKGHLLRTSFSVAPDGPKVALSASKGKSRSKAKGKAKKTAPRKKGPPRRARVARSRR